LKLGLALGIALAVLSFAAPANSQSFAIGEPPVADVTMPEAWSPNETDAGVEANSPDGQVYLSVEVAAAGSDAALRNSIRGVFEWLQERGVKLDPVPDGQPLRLQHWADATHGVVTGRDSNGDPTAADIIVISANPTTVIIAVAWYSPGAERTHGETMRSVIHSIRPAR
jgi:hypothetical protein